MEVREISYKIVVKICYQTKLFLSDKLINYLL